MMHIITYYMKYTTIEISRELPNAIVDYQEYRSAKVRSIYLDNNSDTLIIFIHGAPGSFDAFMDYLKDSSFLNYNLLAYDRPGYANTNSSPMPSILDQSDFLLNIINCYRKEYVVLVGHSYGGPIVGVTLAKYPQKVNKAIMVAPLIDPEHEPIFWFAYIAKWTWTNWILTQDLKTSGIEKFAHAEALNEIEPYWSEINLPILHIHGGKDALAPPNYNIEYSRRMIDSKYLKTSFYPDEGHLILWDRVDTLKREIIGFIQ